MARTTDDELIRGAIGLGMGGHHKPVRGEKDEWLTPPFILEALGPFDLDPCAPVNPPWMMAKRHLTEIDDGLLAPWGEDEFVWLNPPYGQQTWRWLDRLAVHPAGGIALIFARTETSGFFESVWKKAGSLLFLEGRLFFHHVDGRRAAHNSGAPSVLVGYGDRSMKRLAEVADDRLHGSLVTGWRTI